MLRDTFVSSGLTSVFAPNSKRQYYRMPMVLIRRNLRRNCRCQRREEYRDSYFSTWKLAVTFHSVNSPIRFVWSLLHSKRGWSCRDREHSSAVTRIRTWVVSATTRSTNHYTITANASAHRKWPSISHTRTMHTETFGQVTSSIADAKNWYDTGCHNSFWRSVISTFALIEASNFPFKTWLIMPWQRTQLCRDQDSNLGCLGHKREVLTTIRSRPMHQRTPCAMTTSQLQSQTITCFGLHTYLMNDISTISNTNICNHKRFFMLITSH